jgi:AcrR family transcriptional regulator
MRSTTPAAPRLPAARRRRQLLDVALAAFSAGGFHGTSMDDVAAAASVTKPVLYQHFGSKRDLYIALLDDVAGRLIAAIAEATATAASPRLQVEAGLSAYFGFVDTSEDAFRLLFGGGSKRDEDFAAKVSQVEDVVADLIATLITADIPPAQKLTLAHGIVGMAETTCRHWLRFRIEHPDEAPTPDQAALQLAELAWAGLRGVGTHRI